jgi:hypothetical protein
MGLGRDSRKILGFKGLIGKIFRKMGIHLTQVAATGSVAAHGAGGGLSADAGGIGDAV